LVSSRGGRWRRAKEGSRKNAREAGGEAQFAKGAAVMTPEAIAELVDIYDRMRTRYGAAIAMEALVNRIKIGKRAILPDIGGLEPPVKALIVAVAEAHGLTVELLRKHKQLSGVRDEAVYVVRRLFPGVSYPMLGRYLGRDHSSLVDGNQRFERRLAADEVLRARVSRCTAPAVERAEAVAT
jgi:chromosomal replication initiation ATPase DnaA